MDGAEKANEELAYGDTNLFCTCSPVEDVPDDQADINNASFGTAT